MIKLNWQLIFADNVDTSILEELKECRIKLVFMTVHENIIQMALGLTPFTTTPDDFSRDFVKALCEQSKHKMYNSMIFQWHYVVRATAFGY